MPLARKVLLPTVILFAACDSKVTSTVDPVRQKQIATVQQCFPVLFEKGQHVLDLATTWRMNTDVPVPDPAGLSHSGSGPITVAYDVDGCSIAMTIRFYDAAGGEQTGLPLTGTSLSERIDEAATHLRDTFGAGTFLVGDWTLTGTKGGDAFTGSGALTGMIGGAADGNELEELRTTTATPAGGPPPVAASEVSEGTCTLTFETAGLTTDGFPEQRYPIGELTVAIDGNDADPGIDVTLTGTFDNTSVVEVVVDGTLSGRFTYDLETRAFTATP